MYPHRNSEYVRIECLQGSEKSISSIKALIESKDLPFEMTSIGHIESISKKYFNTEISSFQFPHLILLFQNSSTNLDILKQFKLTPKLKSVPIIVISEISDTKFVEDCYSFGANALVPLPQNNGDLDELIQLIYNFWVEFAYLPHLDKSQ